jgi:hypothetical protein
MAEDVAVPCCRRALQRTGVLPTKMTCPEVERKSTRSGANEASQKAVTSAGSLVGKTR